jgi:hypothetical protein
LKNLKVENLKDFVFENQLCKIKGNLKSTKEIITVLSNKKCVAYFYDLESFGYAKDLSSCAFLSNNIIRYDFQRLGIFQKHNSLSISDGSGTIKILNKDFSNFYLEPKAYYLIVLKDPKKSKDVKTQSDFSFLNFNEFVKSKNKSSNYNVIKITKKQYDDLGCNVDYTLKYIVDENSTLKLTNFSFQVLKLSTVRVKEYYVKENDCVELIGTFVKENNKMYLDRLNHDKLIISSANK